ncbi:MAG: HAF repeat-containing protein, partial [Anaerolineae bacterium]|nr:HAF repeat-containing protein [Anaerolineae bacterium]NIN94147.1 HAF repeat-containing protein [Anaerolineae bacterium]
QVIGFSSTASGERHAFLWTAEEGMVDLDTLGGPDSFAYGINEQGQVVGFAYTT